MSSAPVLTVESPPVVGLETPVKLHIASPHGVRRVTVTIEQNGSRYPVLEHSEAPSRMMFWRRRQNPAEVTTSVGRKITPALKDGKAKLLVTAQSNDLRALSTSREIDVEV